MTDEQTQKHPTVTESIERLEKIVINLNIGPYSQDKPLDNDQMVALMSLAHTLQMTTLGFMVQENKITELINKCISGEVEVEEIEQFAKARIEQYPNTNVQSAIKTKMLRLASALHEPEIVPGTESIVPGTEDE